MYSDCFYRTFTDINIDTKSKLIPAPTPLADDDGSSVGVSVIEGNEAISLAEGLGDIVGTALIVGIELADGFDDSDGRYVGDSIRVGVEVPLGLVEG